MRSCRVHHEDVYGWQSGWGRERWGGGRGVEGWVMVGASGYFVNRCVHVWVCGFVLYV